METVLTPAQLSEVKPAAPVVEATPVVTEDIISRATKVDLPVTPAEKQIEEKFDFKEYEATLAGITDPKQKEVLEKAYKSLQRGFNDKFQSLAELRKQYETVKPNTEISNWSPERLKAEMNKPDFISAAQSVMEQTPAVDENSLLSAEEKAKMQRMESELAKLKDMQNQTFLQQQQLQTQKQDEEFKGKYANYDPKAIDTITADMLAGKAQVTREHVYKAYYHDENVKRAYELGKQDERATIKGRVQSASILPDGSTTPPSTVTKQDGETSLSLFRRIGKSHLANAQAR